MTHGVSLSIARLRVSDLESFRVVADNAEVAIETLDEQLPQIQMPTHVDISYGALLEYVASTSQGELRSKAFQLSLCAIRISDSKFDECFAQLGINFV